jgi:hypothetical protein
MTGRKARQFWRPRPVAILFGSCESMHHRHALRSQTAGCHMGGSFPWCGITNAYSHPALPPYSFSLVTRSLVSSDSHEIATSLSSSLQSELATSRAISSIRCSASDSMNKSFTTPSQYCRGRDTRYRIPPHRSRRARFTHRAPALGVWR